MNKDRKPNTFYRAMEGIYPEQADLSPKRVKNPGQLENIDDESKEMNVNRKAVDTHVPSIHPEYDSEGRELFS